MDLRDLVKLAGLADVELLNRLEPSVEEAEGAGFDKATTRPDEEVMDDPLATMGSDADLSLRRYLKARGNHVTVDENVYPDYTVEDVNEAYASFKEGKYKSDAQRKAVHAAKAVAEEVNTSGDYANVVYDYKEDFYMIDVYKDGEKVAEDDGYFGANETGNPLITVFLKLVKEAGLEAEGLRLVSTGGDEPDMNGVFKNGKFNWNKTEGSEVSDNMVERVVLGAEDGGITISMDGKDVGVASDPEELAKLLSDMGVDNNTDIMHSSSVDFASEEGFESDGAAHNFIDQAMEMLGLDESVAEADIDENAFNQAAAAAARAGKDSFEFGGKTHKTTMKKDVAHKLDDDVDMLRKLAGLAQ